MAKKPSVSSARGVRAGKREKSSSDEGIDFSDIPELTAEDFKRARRVGRPSTGNAKQLIAVRISPDVIRKLKILADQSSIPYQTLINELLTKATKKIA